jgi:hypothetical protein
MRLVQALNVIYDANSIIVHKKQSKRVEFSLDELVIADSSTCYGNSGSVMCAERFSSDGDAFLKQHSLDDHEKFCLSYLLTGHSFEQTLGVAYVGGVCESRGSFRDSKTKIPEVRSINAGFIAIEVCKPFYLNNLNYL